MIQNPMSEYDQKKINIPAKAYEVKQIESQAQGKKNY